MLPWVVIFRRHIRHSTPTPSSLRTLALTPLAATLMGPGVSVANKRLTLWLNPLAATLTKNRGGCPPLEVSSCPHYWPLHSSSFFSYSCALFCTRENLNSFIFKRFRTLFRKSAGVGVSLDAFSLPGYLLASTHPHRRRKLNHAVF